MRDEAGSFTIEATLVAPLLVLGTLTMIALSLYVYQLVQLRQLAYETAERAAFGWNDSAAGGGLYRRLGEGAVAWFGAAAGTGAATIELPAASQSGSPNGVKAKLAKSVQGMAPAIIGKLELTDEVWLRELKLQVTRSFPLQALSRLVRLPEVERGAAAAAVTDPVELARLVDLTRSYTYAVRDRISPARARAVLQEPQMTDGGAIPIRSEKEAAAYLRRATGGRQRTYPMAEGKSRVVDALDANGVAHQAFYTYTEGQLLNEQIPKDAKLMREGKVRGVVWHFFRKSGGKELSSRLRAQLERRGIAVIVHE